MAQAVGVQVSLLALFWARIQEEDYRKMIKYLTTQGNNYYLENLLKTAKSKIILISPYIQLQPRIREILKEKKQNGIKISIVCRKKDLKEEITEYLTAIFDAPRLHAKCYLNEQAAIITSLNLYEFSQQNNIEFGVYVENKWFGGKKLYTEILRNANRLCKNTKQPQKHALQINTKYSPEELNNIFDFEYRRPAGIKQSRRFGNIVLFSDQSSIYQDKKIGDIIYYQGQNTGTGPQELKYGNKILYEAYKNKDRTHLFRNYIYKGEYTIIKKPYLENDKWIFQLKRI